MDRKSKYVGVTIRNNKNVDSIRIQFHYKGKRCRESLKLDPTTKNLKYAANLRAEIQNKITFNTFSYTDYFPESKNILKFSERKKPQKIEKLLLDFLKRAHNIYEFRTVESYEGVTRYHLIPEFGELCINDLTASHIRDWLSELDLKIKTIKNIIIPLRHIVEQALIDKMIVENPFASINLKKTVKKEAYQSNYIIDPFSKDEIKTIINGCPFDSFRNHLQFNFFTGLRPEELIALEPADIDLERNIVKVTKAIVKGHLKEPKTRAGNREVILLPQAREAAIRQLKIAEKRLFHHPLTQAPFDSTKAIREFWKRLIVNVGIRYRNPYQMRHTYASMIISHGENIMWLSTQMGHVDTEMIIKRYGKWVPNSHVENGYQFKNNWGNFLS